MVYDIDHRVILVRMEDSCISFTICHGVTPMLMGQLDEFISKINRFISNNQIEQVPDCIATTFHIAINLSLFFFVTVTVFLNYREVRRMALN